MRCRTDVEQEPFSARRRAAATPTSRSKCPVFPLRRHQAGTRREREGYGPYPKATGGPGRGWVPCSCTPSFRSWEIHVAPPSRSPHRRVPGARGPGPGVLRDGAARERRGAPPCALGTGRDTRARSGLLGPLTVIGRRHGRAPGGGRHGSPGPAHPSSDALPWAAQRTPAAPPPARRRPVPACPGHPLGAGPSRSVLPPAHRRLADP